MEIEPTSQSTGQVSFLCDSNVSLGILCQKSCKHRQTMAEGMHGNSFWEEEVPGAWPESV